MLTSRSVGQLLRGIGSQEAETGQEAGPLGTFSSPPIGDLLPASRLPIPKVLQPPQTVTVAEDQVFQHLCL